MDKDVLLPAAIVGTFDVRNYGDLLFPLIAAWRLAEHGITVEAYSPAGVETGWADTAECGSMDTLASRRGEIGGFLIGGGNIIHTSTANLADYQCSMNYWAYPSLWAGTTLLAAIANRPVIWNAPGVSREIDQVTLSRLMHPVMKTSDYVNVRDRSSKNWLRAPRWMKVDVVPDTAADLARMWPRGAIEANFYEMLSRKGFASSDNKGFAAIHVKRRSLADGEYKRLAEYIDAFARESGLTPILLAIGLCHGDDEVAAAIGSDLTVPHIVLDDPLGLKEIAATIGFSNLYVGCSLHGYITASVYGVPARLVAIPSLPKHAGFLEHVGRPNDLSISWQEALAEPRLTTMTSASIPKTVFDALDAHWDKAAMALLRPKRGLSVQRGHLLRQLMSNGLTQEGWAWALSSFGLPS